VATILALGNVFYHAAAALKAGRAAALTESPMGLSTNCPLHPTENGRPTDSTARILSGCENLGVGGPNMNRGDRQHSDETVSMGPSPVWSRSGLLSGGCNDFE
jgi:hypothetical protein